MIYTSEGKVLNILRGSEYLVLNRVVRSLTYQVMGNGFPRSQRGENVDSYLGSEFIEFQSTKQNTITVNYGDGTVISKEFAKSGAYYTMGYRANEMVNDRTLPIHTFTDGYIGLRNITFTFSNPDALYHIRVYSMVLRGSLPKEVNYFKNMSYISYAGLSYIEHIPDSYPKKLTTFQIDNIFITRMDKIPDALFETQLVHLALSYAFNLSDVISSNFFKIGQLKDTLVTAYFVSAMVDEIPESLLECYKLSHLYMNGNIHKKIPDFSGMNLSALHTGSGALVDVSIPYWDLKSLRDLVFTYPKANFADIVTSWRGLFSLRSITGSYTNDDDVFNQFIDAFYELCTSNGSIVSGGGEAPYPNRFRNISWGSGSRSFIGVKQAPVNFTQGISNGKPTNQGEKAYVLQNQYNHTITHS